MLHICLHFANKISSILKPNIESTAHCIIWIKLIFFCSYHHQNWIEFGSKLRFWKLNPKKKKRKMINRNRMIFAVISNNNDKTQKISGFSDTLCVCACVRPLIQLIFSISDWIMQKKKKTMNRNCISNAKRKKQKQHLSLMNEKTIETFFSCRCAAQIRWVHTSCVWPRPHR